MNLGYGYCDDIFMGDFCVDLFFIGVSVDLLLFIDNC